MARGAARAAAATMLLGVACGAAAAQAQSDPGPGPAREIFQLTNQDRAAQGLAPLKWNDALARAAQDHAERMAEEPTLEHQYPGEADLLTRAAAAGAHFEVIAENIAMAPGAEAVERAWMHSTPHRKNILDPRLNALGVAVVERGGTLYAVEDFAEENAALSAEQAAQKVRALLRAEDVDASMPAAAAEEACREWSGMPQGASARAVIRFETPDLSRLPGQVKQQIRAGKYARAAVGACASPAGEAFTTYRVAILFY